MNLEFNLLSQLCTRTGIIFSVVGEKITPKETYMEHLDLWNRVLDFSHILCL